MIDRWGVIVKRRTLTRAVGACALLLVLVLTVVCLGACADVVPPAGEDEIRVNVRLDLAEDIGLLLIAYDVGGSEGAGGISNADKSMLAKDSTDLYWSFEKWQLDAPADTVNVTLDFSAVTQYCEPNYDNEYPDEYVVPMGDVAFSASFGETYCVTITGSRDTGYRVVMGDP